MSSYVENNPETKLIINGTDYTQFFTSATCSGAIEEAARKLTFGLVDSVRDPNLPDYEIKIEDMVQFYAYGEEIFRGYVVDFQRATSTNEVRFTCFDGAFYLLQSQVTRAYHGTTPDATTLDVCAEVNVPVSKTMPGGAYDRLHDGDSVYDIIMTGYTLQSAKDGNQYMIRMDKGALNIVLKGEYVCPDMLTANEILTDADYGESIVGSINRVKIYDESRKEMQTIDAEDSEITGILQAVVQSNNNDATAEAKALLKGIQKTASISGRGRMDCITGNACVVEEPYTTLQGLYYIDGDSHTFAGKMHTMNLELAFENIMDRVTAGQEKENVSDGMGTGNYYGIPTTGPASEMWNILRELGYSQAAAAAMIANAEHESGLDPTRPQTGGPGMGLFQWTRGERWDQLVSWANNNGYDPMSLEAQVRFADHEMKTIGWLMDGVGGYEAFKNAASVEEAHRMFYHGFERPAYNPANYALRESAAMEYMNSMSELERMNRPVGGAVSDGNWTFPLATYSYMSSEWGGSNPQRTNHYGVDFAAAAHTSILAASSGTVSYAGWADGYGNLVVIDHGGGIATAYAHIAEQGIHVRVGDTVATGQLIAGVGTTGPSTGNHLHFEFRKNYTGGAYSGTMSNPREIINY